MSQTITKGIWATGWEYGLTEGEARGEADDVLRILARQQGAVPESLSSRIRTITDIEKLDRLFDFAFDCKSLDEFTQSVLRFLNRRDAQRQTRAGMEAVLRRNDGPAG